MLTLDTFCVSLCVVTHPIALTDQYSPTVLHAGAWMIHDRGWHATAQHFVYTITCWDGTEVQVGRNREPLFDLPSQGIWMARPGEPLEFHLSGPCRLGWIHCRATSVNPWNEKEECLCFHVWHQNSTDLTEPPPIDIWGIDLCHAPPRSLQRWAASTCFRAIDRWCDRHPENLIEANGALAMLFHRWYTELRRRSAAAGNTSSVLDLTPGQAVTGPVKYILDDAPIGTTVENVASSLGISRSSLSRVCRKAKAPTPGRQLRKRRIRQACGLLRTTAMTVAEVGRECGYSNVVSFRTAFRRHKRMSPTEFRNARGSKAPGVKERKPQNSLPR